MMWEIPSKADDEICNLARKLSCNFIQAVRVEYESAYDYDNCHNNVKTHKSLYGGESVIGWYFVKGFGTIQAIRHTVWEIDNKIIDITPVKDKRKYNLFARSTNQIEDYSIPNCYIQSLDKYLSITIEEQKNMYYYVYELVDPRNNQPFYVGKGKGKRVTLHLLEKSHSVGVNEKIQDIRKNNQSPIVRIIAENILDEKLAYDIETSTIRHYFQNEYNLENKDQFRGDYARGKTYEEIYGSEKAKEQRELRSKLQKERGGYGPKQHSEQTKKLFSTLNSGSGNPMYGKIQSEHTKHLISEKAKERVGRLNKNSYCYILTSPAGVEHMLYGGEASNFCKQNNLSWSTLKMQIQKNWPIPRKGKTKGWKLEIKNNV